MPDMMGPLHHHYQRDQGLPAAMRDGVTLYADVYRPDGDGPLARPVAAHAL